MDRKAYLDVAKFYGMLLVFYGHLWLAHTIPTRTVMLQNKFIYAFHMPLFFMLSGSTSKAVLPPFASFLKKTVASRLFPALFFSLLLLAVDELLALLHGVVADPSLLGRFAEILQGQPYSTITWFLVCLMVVECYAYGIKTWLRSPEQVVLAAAGSMLVGLLVQADRPWLAQHGLVKGFWFLHEALVAVFFYAVGYYLKEKGLFEALRARSTGLKASVLVMALGVTGWFSLNNPGRSSRSQIVLMVNSQHGSPLVFVVAALAGSLAVIVLSMLTPPKRVILYFGSNTLALLGANGLFRDVINRHVVGMIPKSTLESQLGAFVICLSISLASMALCVPLVWLFNRFYQGIWQRPLSRGLLGWGT